MTRLKTHRTSLILSGTGGIVGIVLIVWAIFLIRDKSGHALIISKNSIAGQHSYSIIRDGCIGFIQTSLESEQGSLKYAFESNFKVSYRKNNLPVALEGYIQFNSLNQIIGSEFSFDFFGQKWLIGTLGANPIKLIVSEGDSKLKKFTYEFSGPITLEEISKDYFKIIFPDRFKTLAQKNVLFNGLLNNLGIILREESCDIDSPTALPLEQIIPPAIFEKINQNFKN